MAWKTKVRYEDATTGDEIPKKDIHNYEKLTNYAKSEITNGNGTRTITWVCRRTYANGLYDEQPDKTNK